MNHSFGVLGPPPFPQEAHWLPNRTTLADRTLIEASTAEQAIELACSHEAEIDLLLTDVVLTDQSGFVLAQRLRSRQPGLKVLFMTGHAEESAAVREGLAGEFFLNKPFRADELQAGLRSTAGY